MPGLHPPAATYQVPGGAGQRGPRPLPFGDVSVIHIEVALPDHHLRDKQTELGETSSPLLHGEGGPTAPPQLWARGKTVAPPDRHPNSTLRPAPPPPLAPACAGALPGLCGRCTPPAQRPSGLLIVTRPRLPPEHGSLPYLPLFLTYHVSPLKQGFQERWPCLRP